MTKDATHVVTLVVAALVAIAVSACSQAEAADDPSEGPRITVALLDFKFAPALIEVPSDTRFTLEVRNTSKMDHDLTVDALHFKVILKPGRSATRVLGPLPRDGAYDVVCSIIGHTQLGMVGRMVVRKPQSASTGSSGSRDRVPRARAMFVRLPVIRARVCDVCT